MLYFCSDNGKGKKKPAHAKIYTLASLEAIEALLTGECIRFAELDLKFNSICNKSELNVLYKIGPDIAILRYGYVKEKQK